MKLDTKKNDTKMTSLSLCWCTSCVSCAGCTGCTGCIGGTKSGDF